MLSQLGITTLLKQMLDLLHELPGLRIQEANHFNIVADEKADARIPMSKTLRRLSSLQKSDCFLMNKALEEYHDLEARAAELDPDELKAARLSLRSEEEKRAVSKLEDAYGNSYDYDTMREAKGQVSDWLHENYPISRPHSVRQDLHQKQKEVQQRKLPQRKNARDLER